MNRDPLAKRIRYWLIELIAGRMPVVMNVTISRPSGYEGMIAYFPNTGIGGIFVKNQVLDEEHKAIIMPTTASDPPVSAP